MYSGSAQALQIGTEAGPLTFWAGLLALGHNSSCSWTS